MHVVLAGTDEEILARMASWLAEKLPRARTTAARSVAEAVVLASTGGVDCVVIHPSVAGSDARWQLAREARRLGVAVMLISDEPSPEQFPLRGASVVGSRELTADRFAEFVVCLVASATGVHRLG